MKNYEAATYGENISEVYDDLYSACEQSMVDTLYELAGDGPALELGIGTGRVALPLLYKGIKMHGIDASHSMVAKLRLKPRGEEIPVTFGDFAQVEVAGKFSLIYVVFNTFFALLSQEDQVRCFQNVAQHLDHRGVFVIEAFVPDPTRFTAGQALRVTNLLEDQAWMDASLHNPVTQVITSQHIHLTEAGIRFYPVKLRYAFPSELDLMAQLAGLTLHHRWSEWQRSAFNAKSTKHVSVYRAPDIK